MTPTQHRSVAELMMKDATAPTWAANRSYLDAVLAHAELSHATGTGEHYAAAEHHLAEAQRFWRSARQQVSAAHAAATARVHATLADRA